MVLSPAPISDKRERGEFLQSCTAVPAVAHYRERERDTPPLHRTPARRWLLGGQVIQLQVHSQLLTK